jgi:hypothetical protein
VTQPLHVAELLEQIELANVSPVAIELDLPGIRAGAVAPGQRHARGTLAVLLEGSEVNVLDRARELGALLGPRAHVSGQMPQWWGRYPFRRAREWRSGSTPRGLSTGLRYARRRGRARRARRPRRRPKAALPVTAPAPAHRGPRWGATEVSRRLGDGWAAPIQLRGVIASHRRP